MRTYLTKPPFVVGAVALAFGLAGPASLAQAAGNDQAYVFAKYPVEATGANAVAAKDKAFADGAQASLRSLLKRIVLVTAYNRLSKLKALKSNDYLSGVAVETERNSTTAYSATLDFTFEPQAVRQLLRREGIPFVDAQAAAVTVVPIYMGADGKPEAGETMKAWRDAFSGLDGAHSVAPITVASLKPTTDLFYIKALKDGDLAQVAKIANDYGAQTLVLAIAEPSATGRKLNVTLVGRDAVGELRLTKAYRLEASDLGYTAELAAVVSLGILEGRWKALKAASTPGGAQGLTAQLMPVQMFVQYRDQAQWLDLKRLLQETPGVEDFVIGGLTSTGADVSLRYPGGGERLAGALRNNGLVLDQTAGLWIAKPTF